MKKILAVILCVVSIFSLMGCSLFEEKIYEHGDFKYIFETKEDGEKVVRILGLTDEAKKKETIVIPYKLKDYDIKYIGRYTETNDILGPAEPIVDGIYGSYKYLYIQGDVQLAREAIQDTRKRIIYFNHFKYANDSSTLRNTSREVFAQYLSTHVGRRDVEVYASKIVENMVLNEDTGEKEQIFYDSWITLANLQFMRVVGDETKSYWIDNVVSGSKIVAPPNPTREGYTFDGWYKEKECVNKWNFEADVTQTMVIEDGTEITTEMQEREDYATYLYAKWM